MRKKGDCAQAERANVFDESRNEPLGVKSGDGAGGWLKWWPPGRRNFLGQTPPAPFLGLNTKKVFRAAELSLSRFRGHEPRANACKRFGHSWSLMPTPVHIRGRAG